MSQPWKPSPTPPAGRRDPQGAPWPGLIPLRPLGVGDVFGAAWRLVRTHAALLCLVALAGTLLGGAAVFGVLALFPDDAPAAETAWLRRFEAGRFELPPLSLVLPLLVGAVFSYLTIIAVSGLATALVGDASLGRTPTARAVLDRMRGRWVALVAVSVVVAVLVLAGLMLFLVPGFLVLSVLLLAAPVVVLEKAGAVAALQRSARLTRGVRARILGIAVLAQLIASLVSSALLGLLPDSATVSATVVALAVQALVAAVTVPWTAGVIALLYVDTRIRKEGLAQNLLQASMRQV
ncbi:hypothetical protein [Nakamurella deserti]|uniref:hypothetical protein n=1 Tax=Nakamurella deserti TaxID=2164074 RepID=UPI001300AFDA|nr:hypothetical protein [Nakamurella deserti]